MTTTKPEKFRAKKNFNPLPSDDGDEFFLNGFFEFNITKLLNFIRSNPLDFPIIEIDVASLDKLDSSNLSEDTIKKANLSDPIVLGEISPGRFNVIDGNHRLERARRQGEEKILAYRVCAAKHVVFLNSKEAYLSYIKYWNGKVNDLKS